MTKPLIAVIMGSKSDWETMSHCVSTLEALAAEADAANAPAPEEEEEDYTGGAAQSTGGSSSSSDSTSGALASDEALAALREKLAGGEA